MTPARAWFFSFVAVLTLALAAAFPGSAFAQARTPNAGKAPEVRVYLLRGLANIFSFGMDDLATKLKARGIKASVHPYTDWQTLSTMAIEDATKGKRRATPVIIIGHSLGADAAIYMGNKVAGAGVPVPLVVTFDPVSNVTSDGRITRVLNYYQTGGAGKRVAGPRVENVDLAGKGLTHFNMEKASDLHQHVIALIEQPARRAPRRPRPIAPPAAPVASPGAPAGNVAPTASATLAPSATETAAAPSAGAVSPAVMRAPN
ncbi:hypothetical protein FHS55_001281 [Angulomicrobium tetraedrale]|uniref:Thioesterase domain-containing protein n=1 Tax=Ancylobacter tetraedralis TaxID=217068 RepID=A0A839Z7Z1_9HYPH|nr:hypothetical protein [Ancylobacter tetraedralis]MBB3770686.1 hypothetical protein [Ancylobacter tetraedralis]